jgi:hypothetical protein
MGNADCSAKDFFDKLIGTQAPGEQFSERNFFGFRSLVAKEKSLVILIEDRLVFRMNENYAPKALALKGAEMWNPYGRKKKHWIEITQHQASQWHKYLGLAIENILTLEGGDH